MYTVKNIINFPDIKEVVKKYETTTEILKHYGMKFSGGNSTRLKKYLSNAGIDISHILKDTGWNRGKTKENCESIKKYSDSIKESFKNGKIISWCKGKTKENTESIRLQSKKISETVNKKIEEGTWHVSFAKRKTYEYKNFKFHGTWELRYAKWLDNNNIKWDKPKNTFQYFFENKIRKYTPDFYLVDSNEYVEIKGYVTLKDLAKWECFPKHLNLKILKGKDLAFLKIIKDNEYRNVDGLK